jgi:ferredoxin-NADP reductase
MTSSPPSPGGGGRGGSGAPALYDATLARIHEWSADTRSLFLQVAGGARLSFKPGQFISLELPIGDAGEPLVRAYSLASSPEAGGVIEICVDRVPGGPGSTHLFGLAPGAALPFKGPFGSFCLDEPPAAGMVFVGDGTGIAPIRPMVRRALERGGEAPIVVLQGARSGTPLLFADELRAWARAHPRLRWEPVAVGAGPAAGVEPPWPAGASAEPGGLEALVVERYVRADAERTRHFWICGVGDFVRRLRDALRGAGYARRAVRYEQW